jgi:hypothetical protein
MVDVLACGHGQFGGIGNGQWSHQGTPTRVKTLSGLIECTFLHTLPRSIAHERAGNEAAKKNLPIHIYNLSVGQNHVIATLDNSQDSQFGRDVFCFGHNASWQLGLGKRSNQAVPQHMPKLPRKAEPQPDKERQFNIESQMPHHRLQLQPAVRCRGHVVEETAVAAFDTSAVYWKIVDP